MRVRFGKEFGGLVSIGFGTGIGKAEIGKGGGSWLGDGRRLPVRFGKEFGGLGSIGFGTGIGKVEIGKGCGG